MTAMTTDQKFTIISANAENYFGKYAAQRVAGEKRGTKKVMTLEVRQSEVELGGHCWELGLSFSEDKKGRLVASFGLERMNDNTGAIITRATRALRGPKLRQAIIKFAKAKGLKEKYAHKAIEFLDSLVA